MRKIIYFSILSLAIFLSFSVKASSFTAEKEQQKAFKEENLPTALKGWVNWALDGKENKNECDIYYNSEKVKHCYYISQLDVDIKGQELEFKQNIKVLKNGYTLIPGSQEVFPNRISVNGNNKNIISKAGRPYIFLEKGEYTIQGYAKSKEDIRYLFIPNDATIINVSKNGNTINNPTIDANGVLRLETQSTTKSETDDLSIFVYRMIQDNIPMQMEVNIVLNITGKERVENLGKIIPENFVLMGIESNASTYIQKNGDLIVEARPGQANILIKLHQQKDTLDLVLDNSPLEQEVWIFKNVSSRRVIQTPDSLISVQTQNIPLPQAWKAFPAYEVKKGKKFTLKAIDFDMENLDELSLYRNMKLAFDGSFYSIEDRVSTQFRQDGRLSIGSPFVLYSSSIDGEPQAITKTEEDINSGVEVRKGFASIVNILRVDNKNAPIPATGYNRKFNDVSWNLQLAPGYKLFHASGVDKVSQSWIGDWDLMSIFIVALLTVSLFYLLGLERAAIGLILVALLHPIMPQFTYITFALCGLLFLQRNINEENKAYKFVTFVRYSLITFLTIAMFMFAIKHLRSAIYPSLDTDYISMYNYLISTNFLIVFYIAAIILYVFYKIITAAYPLWKKFIYSFGLVFLTLIISAVITVATSGIMYIAASQDTFGYAAEETAYYDYADAKVMKTASAKSRIKNEIASNVNSMLIEKQKDFGRYQSLNIAKNVAQTGVGFPEWGSNRYYKNQNITLHLKGPVSSDDSFRLYLISPTINSILAFIRVILSFLLIGWLLDRKKTPIDLGRKGKDIMKRLFAASACSLMLLAPMKANATEVIPSKEIVSELGDKLSREIVPSCLPECVSVPNGKITNENNTIKLTIFAHSNNKLVIPLPSLRADGAGYVKLENVIINGQKAKNTVGKDNNAFILLEKGVSQIDMVYKLDENADRFLMQAHIRIHYLENELNGLSLNENTSTSQSFQINRIRKAVETKTTSTSAKMEAETFFIVQRNFEIGTLWQVNTVIRRENNLSEAATIEVPLLKGEKVITSEGTLLKDSIRISFAPREKEKGFSSLLPVEQDIQLFSNKNITNYKEIWSFDIDYAWSFNYKNMKPDITETNSLLFNPRPNENLEMHIFRPDGVDGYVITFDKVNYKLSLGRGEMTADLALELRASDAGSHEISVPQGAVIKDLRISGKPYPVTINDNKLVIPVTQGKNAISFTAAIKHKLSNITKFPEFDLNAPAVNIYQTMSFPMSKWLLFASGPVKGPVVLFWSLLPAIMIIAFVLSRFKACPLGFWQWFILFMGLTQSGVLFMLIITSWFVLMGMKDKLADKIKYKKIVHTMLALLTLLFIYSLFKGVYNGLLGNWSMRVVGENSYMNRAAGFWMLSWYQDAVMGLLPAPKVISLPVWVYRCVMILWSTWLSLYFVKWIKWGFKAFTKE